MFKNMKIKNLEKRIVELENILCPNNTHEYELVEENKVIDFNETNLHGSTTIERKLKCKRCNKITIEHIHKS